MTSTLTVAVVVAGSLISASAMAQQLIVYPAKGQNAQQQSKDEGECYVWARNRTGIDPTAGTSAAPPQQQPTGAVARGAAGGALRGAIIADVAGGHAGTGAAAGAVMGGVKGAARQQRTQQQAAQQAQASAMQQFQRAYGACLEGRGYTVK